MILDAYKSPTRRLSYVVPFISNFEVCYVKIYRAGSIGFTQVPTGFAGEDSGKCVCGVCVGRLAATCALSKIEDIYSDTP